MAVLKKTHTNPLLPGKELEVIKLSETAGGSREIHFKTEADTILASLQASIVSGTVSVEFFTEGDSEDTPGNRVSIIQFPTLSAPTDELLLRKAASTLNKIRVVITWTGEATLSIYAKGISVGETTVNIAGAGGADNYGIAMDTTPRLLIPVALIDQNNVSIVNNSTAGGATLYVGFKPTITATSTATPGTTDDNAATPVPPGGSIGLNVTAGLTVYALTDAGIADVRVIQLGS